MAPVNCISPQLPRKGCRQRVITKAQDAPVKTSVGQEKKQKGGPAQVLYAAIDVAQNFSSLPQVAAEGYDKLIVKLREQYWKETTPVPELKAMTKEEVVQSIKNDFERNYFISGEGSMEGYDPDCLFADDFSSFRGLARFQRACANFGGALEDSKLDMLELKDNGNVLEISWRFTSKVGALPWTPALAAKGTNYYTLGSSNRVVEHREVFDVDYQNVIQNLLKPSTTEPTTRWEKLVVALGKPDIGGAVNAIAMPLVFITGAPLITYTAYMVGQGKGPGFFGTINVGILSLVFLYCSTVEIVKVAPLLLPPKKSRAAPETKAAPESKAASEE